MSKFLAAVLFLKKRMLIVAGILNNDGTIDNAASIKRLAEVAVAYAEAGKAFYNQLLLFSTPQTHFFFYISVSVTC